MVGDVLYGISVAHSKFCYFCPTFFTFLFFTIKIHSTGKIMFLGKLVVDKNKVTTFNANNM